MSHLSLSPRMISRSFLSGLLIAGATLVLGSTVATAQGVGLTLGPMFILSDVVPGVGSTPAGGLGFSLGIDYHSVVDDDGILSYGILYSTVPFDTDSIHSLFGKTDESSLELGARQALGFMTSFRFRIGADLDEIAPIINLRTGAAFLFGGEGTYSDGTNEIDLDFTPDIPVSIQGAIGAGAEYPLGGSDNVALVGILGPLLELTFADGPDGPDIDFGLTGIMLSVGIEYRDE